MSEVVVTLKKGEGRLLKSGGLWIYDNEIASVSGDYKDGDMVQVDIPWGRDISIPTPKSASV